MQFDDIKKQLPFTVSSTDTEYLGLVATYLKNPADKNNKGGAAWNR